MEQGPRPGGTGEQKMGAERIGDHLQLARLVSPQRFSHRASEMLGIPFEENQLHGYGVEIHGTQMPLLQMMRGLDLLGASGGVPHLSIGSPSAQLVSNAARSYLVGEGYGVKGMGLVQYDTPTTQIGFGLDTRFRRDTGEEDIGGGVEGDFAFREQRSADALRRLFLLHTGDAPFARIFNVLPYQDVPVYNNGGLMTMGEAAVVVREDQRRGVERRRLLPAIYQVLPTLTDFSRSMHGSFEGDGHNAFMRDGKVIFTDFESVEAFAFGYPDYMNKLGDAWYFEELRKNYPEFLRLYNLTPMDGMFGLRDADWDRITEKVIQGSGATEVNGLSEEKLQKIQAGDKEAIARYAMAGVIGSRAFLRQLGGEMLAETLDEILNEREDDSRMSLEELQSALRTTDLVTTSHEENVYGESCTLTKDAEGNVLMKMKINTFGLPINPEVEVPVTLADIDSAISENIADADSMVQPVDLGENEFAQLSYDLLSGTVYAEVAGAFANIKGVQDPHQGAGDHFEGHDRAKLMEGQTDFTLPLQIENEVERVFTVGDDMKVTLAGDTLRVEAPTRLEHISIANLNKLAYTIHTASLYLQEQGDTTTQLVNITVNN